MLPYPNLHFDPDGDILPFVQLRRKRVSRVAHVAGQMAMVEGNFERREADGSAASLAVIATAAGAWRGLAAHDTGLA
jgi:hypothetical protein